MLLELHYLTRAAPIQEKRVLGSHLKKLSMEAAEDKHDEEPQYTHTFSLSAQEVHPLLQGGQPAPPHQFSKAQMKAFVALCDTIFPSLPLEKCSQYSRKDLSNARLQALEDYFLFSAKDANFPSQAAGNMTQLLTRSQLRLVKLALWLLTSGVGTLVIGGKNAVTCTFPFFSKFASLSGQQREGFLFGLSQSPLKIKQELFRCFTGFIPWFVFTSLGPLGFNPTFAALQYSVGEKEDTQTETPSECQPTCTQIDEHTGLHLSKTESHNSPTCTPPPFPVLLKEGSFPFSSKESLGKLPLPKKENHLNCNGTHASHKENTQFPQNLPKNESHLASRVIDADMAGTHLGAELANLGVSLLDNVSHLKMLQQKKSLRNPADVDIGVKCDAVVLGSGPGGAVVAAKLAQGGHRILILEKGRYFPAGQLSQLEGPSMYAMYEESGCLVTDDSRIMLLAGATVGGGSTINWSASFRTPCHVREEWARSHHLDLFASHVYEDAMDAVCSRLGVQSEVAHENFQNGVLRAGCRALGFHVENIPRNSPPDHQCGFCGLGCKQGKKQGAIQTWLEDAASAGAVVVASCKVKEVLWVRKGKGRRKVAGVVAEVVSKRQHVNIYVETGVAVAACGALWTPSILRQSGLRNGSIGKNLHIHPVQVVWGHFEEGKGAAGESFRGALMTACSNVAANWDTTGYGALIQCAASQPGIISIVLPWVSALDFKERMLKFARTAFFIVLTRDRGGGQVGVDMDGRLLVRYQVSNMDKKSLRDGAEKGLRILAAAGAREVGTCNSDGETFVSGASAADFDAYLARTRAKSFKKLSTITVSAHQMGTCRMGTHPSTSAVKPSGETWEVEGLFVADTSVFPTATGVNPMITVQSIAFCIADSVLLYLQHALGQRCSL